MQCPKCKSDLPLQNRFCPHCGRKLFGRSFSYLWVGLGLTAILGLAWALLSSQSEDSLEAAIEGQLKAMKAQHLSEAYYAFTSQTFQQTTSLDQFKEFVRAYPILVQFQDLVVNQAHADHNKGAATLFLTSGGQNEAEVHYQLAREEGAWKIEKVELVEYRKGVSEEPPNATAAMIAPIKAQLEALRNNDLLGAYKTLVSKQFQLKTPFESFKAFVVAHPILTQHRHDAFKEHEIVDGKGIATIHLDPEEEGMTPVEYRMVNEEGSWKILMMRIAQAEQQKELQKDLETEGMINVVREELSLFAEGKMRQVYNDLIAKETKATVSFENFQLFVQSYPALSSHTTINIREPSFDKGIGRIIAEVIDEKGATVIEYNLSPEEGHWKILGMHIASTPEEATGEATPSSYKVRDLIAAIEAFLSALRANDMAKAYQYTSKEFQYANSQTDFDLFFSKHPAFAQSQASRFEKEVFNNAIATFSGQLILPQNKVMPVEFDLVQEDGHWKILHIYALPAANASLEKAEAPFSASRQMEFVNLVLGTKVDDDGNILNPATTFKQESGDLYATLTIRNGTADAQISLLLRHIDSGSALKPVTAALNDNGDNTLTFVFSPPPKGWPKGSYQLRVTSSSGAFKNFTFTVE